MPTPPKLSNEQRRQAYDRSLELRKHRAELKQWMKSESRPAPGWARVSVAFDRECAQGMKVYDLLVCLPGIGSQRAERLLESARIPDKNTVRACGPKQKERLLTELVRLAKRKPRH